MMQKNNICQSCGMPMNDTKQFGSNEDNSRNEEYCVYCFEKGHFKDAGITLDQKIQKNIEIAVKMGMPREKAEDLAKNVLPRLKRWRSR